MKTYCVGGAVRDELLGLPVKDRDYVVVGATPEEMVAQGYKPVGKDFPVFLHPRTREEYALARTERKTARGYHGFEFRTAPDVTLEEDLARRDLTINALYCDAAGEVFDPRNGLADLEAGRIRFIGDAEARIREDYLRIMRFFRFFAWYGRGRPDAGGLKACAKLKSGIATLSAERVWAEIKRLLAEKPKAIGLAVAGMPVGSPGMEVPGQPPQSYEIKIFSADRQHVFARYRGLQQI